MYGGGPQQGGCGGWGGGGCQQQYQGGPPQQGGWGGGGPPPMGGGGMGGPAMGGMAGGGMAMGGGMGGPPMGGGGMGGPPMGGPQMGQSGFSGGPPPMGGGGGWSAPMGGPGMMGGAGCGGGVQWGMGGGQQSDMQLNVMVDVSPEVVPTFQKGPGDTFGLEVPGVVVRLATSCNPTPPLQPGMMPFKPYEEFRVVIPEVQRVTFSPSANQPPDGRIWAQVTKRGAVMEFPANVSVDAKMKTNSPYGSLILEDVAVSGQTGMKQKVGENVLNWRLQVSGQLQVSKGSGNMGANRLEVELLFLFDCYMGGPPVAQQADPQHSGCPPGGCGGCYGGGGCGPGGCGPGPCGPGPCGPGPCGLGGCGPGGYGGPPGPGYGY